jgi:hypothetical protein
MREIRTSGLMSGEGRRGPKGYRALPRLYLRCIMKNVAPRPGNESLSLPPLHRTRGGAVTPDQVRHIETGNCAIGDHPFSPNHHPVGAMRPAQNQRRHRVAVAGEAQFIELEQRKIGGFSNSDLAKFGAADAGR